MKKLRFNRKTMLAAILLLPAILAASFVSGQLVKRENLEKEVPIKFNVHDIPQSRNSVLKLIENKGIERARDEIKTASKNNYSDGHNLLHIFGEEVYKMEGVKSITVCDGDFGFGCYHGFFSYALADLGTPILADLDRSCSASPKSVSGCAHGLGHGVLEYVGHSNLYKALNICSDLSWKGKLHGCQEGVLMEYFLPGQATNESQARKFDSKNPYDVCPTIDSRFSRACYFGLGQWWVLVLDEDFELMGQYCNQILDTKDKTACFLGLGNRVFLVSHYKVDEAISMCSKMPDSYTEVLCRSIARSLFNSNKLCRDLTREEERLCLDNSDIIASL